MAQETRRLLVDLVRGGAKRGSALHTTKFESLAAARNESSRASLHAMMARNVAEDSLAAIATTAGPARSIMTSQGRPTTACNVGLQLGFTRPSDSPASSHLGFGRDIISFVAARREAEEHICDVGVDEEAHPQPIGALVMPINYKGSTSGPSSASLEVLPDMRGQPLVPQPDYWSAYKSQWQVVH